MATSKATRIPDIGDLHPTLTLTPTLALALTLTLALALALTLTLTLARWGAVGGDGAPALRRVGHGGARVPKLQRLDLKFQRRYSKFGDK